jgi:hypothetical protein
LSVIRDRTGFRWRHRLHKARETETTNYSKPRKAVRATVPHWALIQGFRVDGTSSDIGIDQKRRPITESLTRVVMTMRLSLDNMQATKVGCQDSASVRNGQGRCVGSTLAPAGRQGPLMPIQVWQPSAIASRLSAVSLSITTLH